MKIEPNQNHANWLSELNGKMVDKIFQVDYNFVDRDKDIYLPWLFFITFSDFDAFLEIEGDFDGVHICANLFEMAALDAKITENHYPNDPLLWQVYDTNAAETLGKLLGQKMDFIEYGIPKEAFEMSDNLVDDEKSFFHFIRFHCPNAILTIQEGYATGLGVSDDPKIRLNFEETFDIYNTK
jgi:hypothetical protein